MKLLARMPVPVELLVRRNLDEIDEVSRSGVNSDASVTVRRLVTSDDAA